MFPWASPRLALTRLAAAVGWAEVWMLNGGFWLVTWLGMDGTKSFKKWRRGLLPEDFNFALSARGSESDVIKRELEIVQR